MGSRLCIILLTVFTFTIHASPPEGYGLIGQRRCFQPVRIEIPECQNTFYNFTGLPNLVEQESQVDARHQLQTFKPLITYKCSNQLAFFLCSVYAPMCDVNTHHLIGPCRPLCERVRKRCTPVLRIFDFDWPANLNCSRFPERNTVGGAMCMEGPEAGEDEEDADTPAVDASVHGSSEGEVSKAEWPWPQKTPAAATSHTGRGILAEERDIIPAEGIIRQIEDLPEDTNMDLSPQGPQLQNWLARLNQNPLPTFFGNNEIPVALLVSSLRFCSHLYKPTSYIFINRTGRCAPHCSADILFSQNAKNLATVWTSVISGLCLLATTCALLSYAIQPSLFHPLERPVIYIAGCQLAYALGFALRLKLGREAVACGVDPASGYSIRLQEGLENSNCALVFLIQYYFFVAGAIWWAMMVIGWTRCTSYAYRLIRNPCRDSASAYVPPKSPCCCLGRSTRGEPTFVFEETGVFMDGESGTEANRSHGPPSGVTPAAMGHSGGAQPATTSSLRASHVNRRIQTAISNSIDLNCLAKEHVIAWLTPGLLTVAVLVTRQVDADELLGICSVGRQNTRTMLIFMLVPQFLFLLLGLVAFVVCAFYLHRLGRLAARKSCDGVAPSTTMSNMDVPPARCLAFQSDQQQGYLDPSYEGVSTSEASSGCFSGQMCCCCRRSLRWDAISTRLGFFTLLYIVPAISIFVCDFYEFLFRDSWLAGNPSTAVSSLLQTHTQLRGRITPEIFLLRTFMSLVTGLATCLWLLSIKGIDPWRHLARQIESRCARSGYFCFSTHGLKTPATAAPTASARPLPDPNTQAYAKTKETHQAVPCSPHNPSTSSTVLHPYAVYQHRCSSSKSDGLMATHCDNQERYHGQVLLASRPPAGPGLDAGEQLFLPSQAETVASGGTLTSVSSPTQASGYYSSASNNIGATRGAGGGGGGRPSPAPCPPPNTSPLPPFGGRNDPKVPHGSAVSNSPYPDWWGPNGVKNFNRPQNRQTIL